MARCWRASARSGDGRPDARTGPVWRIASSITRSVSTVSAAWRRARLRDAEVVLLDRGAVEGGARVAEVSGDVFGHRIAPMWGIGEEGWMQLWSGFIGSVVGAIAAALVALWVVSLTNKHQTSLAKEAAEKQSQLFDKQLAEQRTALDVQLEKQQESLNRQLHEQRLEARRERERSAMAVMLDGLTVLRAEARNPEFDHAAVIAEVAVGLHRWRLELDDEVLGEELQLWPSLLWEGQHYVRNCYKNGEAFAGQALRLYQEYLDFLREICIRWSGAESDEYGTFMNEMADFRLGFPEKLDKVENRNQSDVSVPGR